MSTTGLDATTRAYCWTGALRALPASARLTITLFLAIIGSGYLVAVANIYHSHRLADGIPGLSIDDIRAIYGGLTVRGGPGAETPSRMLTMIRTSMREYIRTDADFSILETWLKAGGTETGLDEGDRRNTPRRVIIRNCLRCHAIGGEGDIAHTAPFGPDALTVDYTLIRHHAAPQPADPSGVVRAPPQYSIPRLVLFSHQHMLSIPVFTLIVGLMFSATRASAALRAFLTPLPMLSAALDFGGWWLSRLFEPLIYLIAGAGAVFGATLGLQILLIVFDLWLPLSNPHRPATGPHQDPPR